MDRFLHYLTHLQQAFQDQNELISKNAHEIEYDNFQHNNFSASGLMRNERCSRTERIKPSAAFGVLV